MDDLKKEWITKQNTMKDKLEEKDRITNISNIDYIASFHLIRSRDDEELVAVSIILYDFESKKCIYKNFKVTRCKIPYISGFVGFAESELYNELYNEMLNKHPSYVPDVIIINSYGKLHPRCAGSATQLALKLNIPTIGIGKVIIPIDGLYEMETKKYFREKCNSIGDYIELKGKSNIIYGAALKNHGTSNRPLYVSVGNYITLQTAINIIINCSTFITPEPVRIAERFSKDKLKEYLDKK